MQSTRELVELAKQGDAAAIRALTERYEQAVVTTAWNILGDFHLAQDIAQESFVLVFSKLMQLRSDDAFGPWVLATTRRKALRARSKQPREVYGVELSDIVKSDSTEMSDFDDVLVMLQRLPDHERDVVCLRYVSGLTMKQISEDTGRSVGTVTKQLTRAIARLKTLTIEVP